VQNNDGKNMIFFSGGSFRGRAQSCGWGWVPGSKSREKTGDGFFWLTDLVIN
jgi:hypothetical protein